MNAENQNWGFHTPPEEQDAIDAKYKKLNKLSGHGKDYYVTHNYSANASSAELFHETQPYEPVGSLDWDNRTGHVAYLGVIQGHRHALPKLLSEAKKHADTEGYAPPLHSDDLSRHSHKLATKYAPEHIPQDSIVEGVPRNQYEMGAEHFHKATEHVNALHAKAIAATPAHEHEELGYFHQDAQNRIGTAKMLHNSFRTGGAKFYHESYVDSLNQAQISGHLMNETYKKHNGTDIPGYNEAADHIAKMYQ